MNKNKSLWRWIIFAVLVSLSIMAYVTQGIPKGIDISGGYRFVLGFEYPEDHSGINKSEVQSTTLEILRNRLDNFGTKETVLYEEKGTGRIVMEIPGISDDDRQEMRSLISQQAVLSFHLVPRDNLRMIAEFWGRNPEITGLIAGEIGEGDQRRPVFFPSTDQPLPKETVLRELRNYHSPGKFSLKLQKNEDKTKAGGTIYYEPVFIERFVQMKGDTVAGSHARTDQYGAPYVSLDLTPEGGKEFFEVTRDNVGRRLAIVLDGWLYSAPNLNEAIAGGSAQITGSFTMEEVTSLVNALRSGSLSVPIRVDMEQQIEPTLGKKSIEQGVVAAIAGALLVVVFMAVYYRVAGIVVNLALIADVLLMPLAMILAAGFLGVFGGGGGGGVSGLMPTLTLPGIAGLVLTIGMAVDANVLIFERIREEQRAGKRLGTAVQSGYEKVFSTIFDANITTLLVAIILFTQGSGPIRGFAVMLTAGIIVSMYTALVFTRLVFDYITSMTSITKIKMMSFVKEDLNWDFLGKRKIAAGISAALLVVSIAGVAVRGKDVLGVDFTGGTAMTFTYNGSAERAEEDEIRKLLNDAGVQEAFIQYQNELNSTDGSLLVKVSVENAEKTREALLGAYSETKGFKPSGSETISGAVSSELAWKGITAILVSLVGIVIYISFRFEFAFAVGAIAALAHDIVIALGLYFLFGRQLSLPIIAAMLTIVGYSVNDTIVVFDRIREDIKLIKGRPYVEVANISINQTLSRTVLTSLTTLLTVTMLLIFGGGSLFDFALALFIGVIVGTYSSTFVATPVMLLWHKDDKTASAAI